MVVEGSGGKTTKTALKTNLSPHGDDSSTSSCDNDPGLITECTPFQSLPQPFPYHADANKEEHVHFHHHDPCKRARADSSKEVFMDGKMSRIAIVGYVSRGATTGSSRLVISLGIPTTGTTHPCHVEILVKEQDLHHNQHVIKIPFSEIRIRKQEIRIANGRRNRPSKKTALNHHIATLPMIIIN